MAEVTIRDLRYHGQQAEADFEPLLEALLNAGAEAKQEVRDVGGGKLIASVNDADGNVIGLIQSA